ncbi:Detected protein of unknown function [Hibiscus syriacus]|uniref:Reverse transcriptase Ty1/copia-type domain-containing protein n=1 Tax=Hibiscus syriacus TaxID=106335 RepID=A0A6A3BG20_HIBSY|nr:Detected protein of unknown function [Hibiscus syriacus]
MSTTSSPTPDITSNPEIFFGSAAQSEGNLVMKEPEGTELEEDDCDIWGPSRVKNADNCKWFITFIDDHSRITWTYLLKDKSETAGDPYFTQAEIQGETWKDFQPHQLSPPTLHSQPSELPPILSLPTDLSPVTTPIDPPVVPITTSLIPTLNTLPENTLTPIQNIPQTTPIKQFGFYTRKIKHIPEAVLQSDACRELDLGPAAEIEEEISKSTFLTLDDFPIAIRKGVRQCTKHPIEKFAGYNSLMPSFQAFTTNLDKEQVPTSIAEALKDSNGEGLLKRKFVHWRKMLLGLIQLYKARLVARGFTQTYEIDFTETFAPVAKLNTVRVLISLVVNCDWKLYQLDVKNAFLNGKLKEEAYMKLPPGLKSVEGSNKVCKLNKSLYGLKQSPRAWFERFTKVILKNGYKQSLADHTLFIKVTSTNKKAILIVYVDDIILTGDDEEEICNLKKLLNKEFETKDLGKLRYFLGMEVTKSKEGLVINQRKYVLDLLKETGFLGCKPNDTPMEASLKFNKEDESLVDKEKFQRLVGKLIYLSLTRLDIAFPVNVISQHMTNPTEEHMATANRILKYLKKTLGHGLMFKKTQDKTVKIFTDSSWAGDLTERRSTGGYCTFVWGNLTTWRSKKQSVVSRNSAEAKFRALALGICEGIWILKLLKELVTNQEDHFEVLCDNQSAIQIAKNPVQYDRTKRGEEHSFILKPASSVWKNLKTYGEKSKASSWKYLLKTFNQKGSCLIGNQYAIMVACRCNYSESRLFLKQPTNRRPRISRDLMISVTSKMSGQYPGSSERSSQLPVLTLKASNLTSEDLTMTVLAPASFTSPPSVLSLNSYPTTPRSPFLGFSAFAGKASRERHASAMQRLGSMPTVSESQKQNGDARTRSTSFDEQLPPIANFIPTSALECTHLWLQVERVPAQSTATIKMELLPLTEGIITLDSLRIDVKEKALSLPVLDRIVFSSLSSSTISITLSYRISSNVHVLSFTVNPFVMQQVLLQPYCAQSLEPRWLSFLVEQQANSKETFFASRDG